MIGIQGRANRHHNKFAEAWWIDENVPIYKIKCVFSAYTDV